MSIGVNVRRASLVEREERRNCRTCDRFDHCEDCCTLTPYMCDSYQSTESEDLEPLRETGRYR